MGIIRWPRSLSHPIVSGLCNNRRLCTASESIIQLQSVWEPTLDCSGNNRERKRLNYSRQFKWCSTWFFGARSKWNFIWHFRPWKIHFQHIWILFCSVTKSRITLSPNERNELCEFIENPIYDTILATERWKEHRRTAVPIAVFYLLFFFWLGE